jgi:hypothetical protein
LDDGRSESEAKEGEGDSDGGGVGGVVEVEGEVVRGAEQLLDLGGGTRVPEVEV